MRASAPARLPGWADFNNGDIFYGMPDLESRGFKIANDKHGPPIDPDRGDRVTSPGSLADARAYLAKRFPALAGRAAQRRARLPVREQLQRRPADRSPSRRRTMCC